MFDLNLGADTFGRIDTANMFISVREPIPVDLTFLLDKNGVNLMDKNDKYLLAKKESNNLGVKSLNG